MCYVCVCVCMFVSLHPHFSSMLSWDLQNFLKEPDPGASNGPRTMIFAICCSVYHSHSSAIGKVEEVQLSYGVSVG